ncbi:MAG: TonB-dependent receptor plug domain-containing protein [Limnohabitans sp.]|nr:TonB-dependent receptor plug domain-containing protein [Limnohabitans sp.]
MFFINISSAQVILKGKIINDLDGNSMVGVTIKSYPTKTPQKSSLITTSYSSFDGTFKFKSSINEGEILISYPGFITKIIPFSNSEKSTLDFGVIMLKENIIKEVEVTSSTIDVAKNRKTPIASSTFFDNELKEKTGNNDIIQPFNRVSSIYVSKFSGSYGESRMSIRGFKQNDIAPMIDGIPLYDLENGSVDWTGMTSITDALSSVEIQKGLGASKLVNSSVAGTVNMILRDPSSNKGAYISNSTGNDGYNRTVFSFGTGKLNSGFSANLMLSNVNGDGYVDQTKFRAYSYYLGLGFTKNKHDFSIKFFGSPQWHNQRKTAISLWDYLGSYDPQYFNDIKPKYNKDWGYYNGEAYNTNTNYGHKPLGILQWDWDITNKSQLSVKLYGSMGSSGKTGLDGAINGFGNYVGYNDGVDSNGNIIPNSGTLLAGFNWNHENNFYANDNSNEVSMNLAGLSDYLYTNNQIDFDRIRNYNTGNYNYFPGRVWDPFGGAYIYDFFKRRSYNGKFYNSSRPAQIYYTKDAYYDYDNSLSTGMSLISQVSDQKIYGGIINFKKEVLKGLTLNIGVDGRKTKYNKRKIVADLFGADAYWSNVLVSEPYNPPYQDYTGAFTNSQMNLIYDQHSPQSQFFNIKSKGESIDYDYNANIDYIGAYGQIEEHIGNFDFLLQGGYNKQFVERVDNMPIDPQSENSTGKKNLEGFNLKTGINYNITKNHNLWVNAGRISRAPVFVTVYPSRNNTINENFKNQVFESIEAGYGFKSTNFTANINGYIATDKGSEEPYYRQDQGAIGGVAEINKRHTGIEFEILTTYIPRLTLSTALSYNISKYDDNAIYRGYYKYNGNENEIQNLNIKDLNIGGAPQRIANFGASYRAFKNFNIGGLFKYSDRMYSNTPLWRYSKEYGDYKAPIELPGFGVLDSFADYKFFVHSTKQAVFLRLNIDNVLDRLFISESNSSILPSDTANSNGTYQDNNFLYKGIPTTNNVLFGFGRTWNFTVRYEF